MPGLYSYGRDMAARSQVGLRHLADMEQRREAKNEDMEAAETQQRVSGVVGGATLGATVGGPIGAAVGGIIGFAATALF